MMFNLSLSLQLNISSRRDRNHGMDDWLKDEIEAARERKELRERKLARREQDAQVIDRDKAKFWQALFNSLRSAVDEFNASGVSDEPVTFDVKEPNVWIRTPGYPNYQLVLSYREGMNNIHVTLTRRENTRDTGYPIKSTLDFDVNDDGHIMVRDDSSLMDVSQATAYLMRKILHIIHAGR